MLPALATAIFLGTLQVQRLSANRFGTPSDYTSLISHPQAWAFAIGKFLTDSMWWFYMTWLPKFLYDRHDLNLLQIGLPLIVIYLMADVGSISGGWLSSAMIKRGYTINRARKTALLICALGVLPIMFAQYVSGMWTAVLILGLATASHQGFSSNLYTLVSDMFPRRAVGSVAGLGGTCGYLGASAFQILVGYVVVSAVVPATPATAGDTTAAATAGAAVVAPSYLIPFICASLAYLVAVLVIHLLAPRLEPAIVDEAPREGFEPLPPSQPRA